MILGATFLVCLVWTPREAPAHEPWSRSGYWNDDAYDRHSRRGHVDRRYSPGGGYRTYVYRYPGYANHGYRTWGYDPYPGAWYGGSSGRYDHHCPPRRYGSGIHYHFGTR
jgi:hypothetical protein